MLYLALSLIPKRHLINHTSPHLLTNQLFNELRTPRPHLSLNKVRSQRNHNHDRLTTLMFIYNVIVYRNTKGSSYLQSGSSIPFRVPTLFIKVNIRVGHILSKRKENWNVCEKSHFIQLQHKTFAKLIAFRCR